MIRPRRVFRLAALWLATTLSSSAWTDISVAPAGNCLDWKTLAILLAEQTPACDSDASTRESLRDALEAAFAKAVIPGSGNLARTVEEDKRPDHKRTACLRQGDGRFLPMEGHYVVWRNYTTDYWIRYADQTTDAPAVDRTREQVLRTLRSLMSSKQMQCLYESAVDDALPIEERPRYNVRLFSYSTDGTETLNLGVEIGTSPETESGIDADLCAYKKSLAETEDRDAGENCPEIKPADGPPAENTQPSAIANNSHGEGGEEDGTSSLDGSGEGALPPGAPPWVENLAMIILRYYGLDQFAQFGALALMMVAPDLLEELAAFSAELTDDLANEDLDEAMKILHEAYKIGSALNSLSDSYDEVAGADGFRDALATTAQEIQNMPPELREQLRHVLSEDAQKIVDAAGGLAALGDDAGPFLDEVFADDQSIKRFAEIATEKVGAKVEEAVIKATMDAVQDAVGIQLDSSLMRALYHSDAEFSAQTVGRQLLQSVAEEAHLSPDDLDAILDGDIEGVARRKAEDAAGAFLTSQIRTAGGDPALFSITTGALSGEMPEGKALLNAAISAVPADLRGPAARMVDAGTDTDALAEAARDIASGTIADVVGGPAADALITGVDPQRAIEEATLHVIRRELPPGTLLPGATVKDLADLAVDTVRQEVTDSALARELLNAIDSGTPSERLLQMGQSALAQSLAAQSSALDSQIVHLFKALPASFSDSDPVGKRAKARTSNLFEAAQDTDDLAGIVSLLRTPSQAPGTRALLEMLPNDEAPHKLVRALRAGDMDEARASAIPLLTDGDRIGAIAQTMARDMLADTLANTPAARSLLGADSAESMAQALIDGDSDALLVQLSDREDAIRGQAAAPLIAASVARLQHAARDLHAPGSGDLDIALSGVNAYKLHMEKAVVEIHPAPLGLREVMAHAGLNEAQIAAAVAGDLTTAFGDWLVTTSVKSGAAQLARDAAVTYLPRDLAVASAAVLDGSAPPETLVATALGNTAAGTALAAIASGDVSPALALAEGTLHRVLPAPVVALLLRPLPIPPEAANDVRPLAAQAVAMAVRQQLRDDAGLLAPGLAHAASGAVARVELDALSADARNNLAALIFEQDPQCAALLAYWDDDDRIASVFGAWSTDALRGAGLNVARLLHDTLATAIEDARPGFADALRSGSGRTDALRSLAGTPSATGPSLVAAALQASNTGTALLIAQTLAPFRTALLSQVAARGLTDAAAAEGGKHGFGPEAAELLSRLDPVAALQSPSARDQFAQALQDNASTIVERAVDTAREEAAAIVSVVMSADPVELALSQVPVPYRGVIRAVMTGDDVNAAAQAAAVTLLTPEIGDEAASLVVTSAADWLFADATPSRADTETAALTILRDALRDTSPAALPGSVTQAADLLTLSTDQINALLDAGENARAEDLTLGLLAVALDDGSSTAAYLRGAVERQLDLAIIDSGLPSDVAAFAPLSASFNRVLADRPEPALQRLGAAKDTGSFAEAARRLDPNNLGLAVSLLEADGASEAARLLRLAALARLEAGWRVTAQSNDPAAAITALVALALSFLPQVDMLLGAEGQAHLRALAAGEVGLPDAIAALERAIAETPDRARTRAAEAYWTGLRRELSLNAVPDALVAALDEAVAAGKPVPHDLHPDTRAALSAAGFAGDAASQLLIGQTDVLAEAAAQTLSAAALSFPGPPIRGTDPIHALADLLRPLVAAQRANAPRGVAAEALTAIEASFNGPITGTACDDACIDEAQRLLQLFLAPESTLALMTGTGAERRRMAHEVLDSIYCRADAVTQTGNDTTCRWLSAAQTTRLGLKMQSAAALGSQRDMDDLFDADFLAPTERRQRVIRAEADRQSEQALADLVRCTRPAAAQNWVSPLPESGAMKALLPEIEAMGAAAAPPSTVNKTAFEDRRDFMNRFIKMSTVARQCLALGLADEAFCTRCLPAEPSGNGLPKLPRKIGLNCGSFLTDLRDKARIRAEERKSQAAASLRQERKSRCD